MYRFCSFLPFLWSDYSSSCNPPVDDSDNTLPSSESVLLSPCKDPKPPTLTFHKLENRILHNKLSDHKQETHCQPVSLSTRCPSLLSKWSELLICNYSPVRTKHISLYQVFKIWIHVPLTRILMIVLQIEMLNIVRSIDVSSYLCLVHFSGHHQQPCILLSINNQCFILIRYGNIESFKMKVLALPRGSN